METKAVIVLCGDLPAGLKANIAAVLGMSLGRYRPELIGVASRTADQTELPGITTIPLPILTSPEADLGDLFEAARASVDLVVPFGIAALTTKTYAEYQEKLALLTDAQQQIKGLLLLGSKKPVNKLVGQLALLR